MTKKTICFGRETETWRDFFEEFLDGTETRAVFLEDSAGLEQQIREHRPGLLFIIERSLSPAVIQKVNSFRIPFPAMKICFMSSEDPAPAGLQADFCFPEGIAVPEMQKKLVRELELPDTVKILTVDDEPEVGQMIADYFSGRSAPSFDVTCAGDGEQALELIEKDPPHVLILDIKMPALDGRAVYRITRTKYPQLPVIIFFDAISGVEIEELHQTGRPAIIEKGSRESEMPNLLATVRKLAWYSL